MNKFVKTLAVVLFSMFAFAAVHAQTAESPAQSDFSVGENWQWEQFDSLTKVLERKLELTVFDDQGTLKFKRQDGRPADLQEIYSGIREGVKKPRVVWPISVGKTWVFEEDFVRESDGRRGNISQNAKVTSYEEVAVPAGKFMAFKIEYEGFYRMFDSNATGGRKEVVWYSPEAKAIVKFETDSGRFKWVRVLVSYKK